MSKEEIYVWDKEKDERITFEIDLEKVYNEYDEEHEGEWPLTRPIEEELPDHLTLSGVDIDPLIGNLIDMAKEGKIMPVNIRGKIYSENGVIQR